MSNRVKVTITEAADIDGNRPGVRAVCSKCDHVTESFGTGSKSRVRSVMLLREECPLAENNFYYEADEGGESRLPDPVVKPWWEKPQKDR